MFCEKLYLLSHTEEAFSFQREKTPFSVPQATGNVVFLYLYHPLKRDAFYILKKFTAELFLGKETRKI